MSLVRSLFSFSQKEVRFVFKNAYCVKSIKGLKLLRCNISFSEEESTYGKLLIIATRKTGKANERNKIKRRVKEIFYTNKLFQGYSDRFIVLIYKEACYLNFKELSRFFIDALNRDKALRNEPS